MKKYLLSALIGLSAIGTASNTQAQSFTLAHDTVSYTVYGSALIPNPATSTSIMTRVKWRVFAHTIPATWQGGIFGICDNVTCYGSNILTDTGYKKTDTFGVNKVCNYKVQIDLSAITVGNQGYIAVEYLDTATMNRDTSVYIINKWSTGVATTAKLSDNIVLYPLPAHNEINILFDANSGITNIGISNIIGKTVGAYRVSGSSANIDISNIPAGVYFARLTDGQGKIIATRKFIRQ